MRLGRFVRWWGPVAVVIALALAQLPGDASAQAPVLVAQQPTDGLADRANMERDRDRSQRLSKAERDRALKLFDEAFALYQAGDFEAAKLGFERGLGIDPANGRANFYFGDILARVGDRESARARYERSLYYDPDTAEGLKAKVALGKLPPPPPPDPPTKPIAAGIQDCEACPRMAKIRGGEFIMGATPIETEELKKQVSELTRGYNLPYEPWNWSLPRHRVSIRPFLIGIYEVTFAEWDACIAGGGCNGYRPGDERWGRGQRPVINVSWNDAQSYVLWLSRRSGKRYRLPTESEWEYAARAGTSTKHYWGDEIGHANAHCRECGSPWYPPNSGRTAPIGQFEPNAFGLYDILGNAAEWVQDCTNLSYAGGPTDGSAWASGDCRIRPVRGGSFYSNPMDIRAASRSLNYTDTRQPAIGFRVVRDE